jgi:hypothetical protein
MQPVPDLPWPHDLFACRLPVRPARWRPLLSAERTVAGLDDPRGALAQTVWFTDQGQASAPLQ